MKIGWRLALIAVLGIRGIAGGDAETIRQLRAKHNQAIADRDLASLAAAWRTDIQVTVSSGSHFDGADAYLEAFRSAFSEVPGVQFVRTPQHIDISEDGTLASELGQWVGTYPNRTPATVKGTYLACWRKDEKNTWLISAELFIPLQSEP